MPSVIPRSVNLQFSFTSICAFSCNGSFMKVRVNDDNKTNMFLVMYLDSGSYMRIILYGKFIVFRNFPY